jgi:hypothetical protein
VIDGTVAENAIERARMEGQRLGDAAYEHDAGTALGHVLPRRPQHGGRGVQGYDTDAAQAHLAAVLCGRSRHVQHPPSSAAQRRFGGERVQPSQEEFVVEALRPLITELGVVPVELQLRALIRHAELRVES